jgi:flagellar biosynthesis protein FlhA
MRQLFDRYVGRSITVQCHGYRRYIGRLECVTSELIVLHNATAFDDYEGGRWQDEATHWNVKENNLVGFAETVISINSISALITNDNDELLPISQWLEEQSSRKDEETENQIPPKRTIRLEFGARLISLCNEQFASEFGKVRSQLKNVIGFEIPKVCLHDNLALEPCTYRLLINGILVGAGSLEPDKRLLLCDNNQAPNVPGIDTREPVFGLPAKWISEDQIDNLIISRFDLISPTRVMLSHVQQLMMAHWRELFSFETTCDLLESECSPILRRQVFYDNGQKLRLHKVLLELMSEGVAPICLDQITIGVAACNHESITEIVTAIRPLIINSILRPAIDDSGQVQVVEFYGELLSELPMLVQSREHQARLAKALDEFAGNPSRMNKSLVLCVPSNLRQDFSQSICSIANNVIVVSGDELRYTKLKLHYVQFGVDDFCQLSPTLQEATPTSTQSVHQQGG